MNNKNSIYLVLAFTLLFFGCEKLEIGKAYDCSIGKKYNLNWDLSFTIDSINDYRCPIDVVCVWAGDVKLFINIDRPNNSLDTAMYLNNPDRNPVQIGDYSLKVLEVNPLPKSNVITDPKDILVKMIILKN